PMGGFQGQATDILIHAKEMKKIKENTIKILSELTSQKVSRIAADIERDFIMNSQEALEYGIIDKVITERKKIKTEKDEG
ncbi:MAG: ATP-dependent Clp protease proteolytic subunit, partial [Candidatus Aminicenantes bacterium]|nr:ATP-dependent Clp protease proteolytic subunit [Candidatus Aminicenantes bacterium]